MLNEIKINLSRSVLMSDQELEMQAEADEILEYEEEGIDSETEELE